MRRHAPAYLTILYRRGPAVSRRANWSAAGAGVAAGASGSAAGISANVTANGRQRTVDPTVMIPRVKRRH